MMRTRTPLIAALVTTALLGLATPTPAGAGLVPPLVVSGYSDARVDSEYGLFSTCGDDLRAFLTDTANFGTGGTSSREVSLASPGVDTVTPGSLDGVDVFFTGWVETDTYTPDERDALLDYVLGGGAMIATTDDTGHDISDIFGVTLDDSNYDTGTPSDLTSPLIDGPFGTVSQLVFSGNQGIYSDLGPAAAVATADPDLGPAVAVIPPGGLGAGSGPVVLVADVDVFTTSIDDCSFVGGGLEANETFAGNVFAYLIGLQQPAPTTTTTAPTTTTTAPATTAAPAATTTPRFTG